MALELQLKSDPAVPLEVEGVTPCATAKLTLVEIEQLPIFEGNRKTSLAEFFSVTGDPSDARIDWRGDLRKVHWIGSKMSSGAIQVHGSVGRHVGSEMKGGEIEVHGDASDWVGAEMKGGLIRVRGRAGHLVGAAYRGSARGMTGGQILIHGAAGNEIGHTMRRGLVAIGGEIGDLAGFNMLAGTLLLFGDCGIRHGAGLKRGTVGFFGAHPQLLPTYQFACRHRPLALTLLLRQLRQLGFPLPDGLDTAQFDLYNGDLLEGGRGEVLLRAV